MDELFLNIIFAVLLPISIFSFYIFTKFTMVNGEFHFHNGSLPPSWIFKIRKLLADGVQMAEMRHHAKFR